MATNHSTMDDQVITEEDKPKSKRPKETKFKQQNLPAWQPILTASTVLPAFLAIGLAFIPLGVSLLITSNNVKEHIIDYTNCKMNGDDSMTCAEFFKNISNAGKTCNCTYENVTLSSQFDESVYVYYGLTNFYQNHRRYVRSRDDDQLHGDSKSPGSLIDDCDPYKTFTSNGSTYGYAPCGAIANSLFNDSFTIKYMDKNVDVGLIRTGIAWVSDKSVKFNNPSGWLSYIKPPNWHKIVTELDPEDPSNNGYKNEDLIVWMRTAALPTFRKLYRRVNHTVPEFANGLPAGKYMIDITYNYPVTAFDGTKSIIISTTSWLGGKNSFLGIAYIVVGSLCIILGLVFLLIHLKWGKKMLESLEDERYFTQYYMGNTLFNVWTYTPTLYDSFSRLGTGLHCLMSRREHKDDSLIPILSPSEIDQIEAGNEKKYPLKKITPVSEDPHVETALRQDRRRREKSSIASNVNSCFGPASHGIEMSKVGHSPHRSPVTLKMSSEHSPVRVSVSPDKPIDSKSSFSSIYSSLARKSSASRELSQTSSFLGPSGSFMAQKLKELKLSQGRRRDDHHWVGHGKLSSIWESKEKLGDMTSDGDKSSGRPSLTSSITTHTSAESWVSRGIQVSFHKKPSSRKRSRSNKVYNSDTFGEESLFSTARIGGPVMSEDISSSMIFLKKVSMERLECWIPHILSPRDSHSLRASQSSLFLPTPEDSPVQILSSIKSDEDLLDLTPTVSQVDVSEFETVNLHRDHRLVGPVAFHQSDNENQNKQVTRMTGDFLVKEDLEQKSNSNNNLSDFLETCIQYSKDSLSDSDLRSTPFENMNVSVISSGTLNSEIFKSLSSVNGMEINYEDKDIYEKVINEELKAIVSSETNQGKEEQKWIIMISVAVQTD